VREGSEEVSEEQQKEASIGIALAVAYLAPPVVECSCLCTVFHWFAYASHAASGERWNASASGCCADAPCSCHVRVSTRTARLDSDTIIRGCVCIMAWARVLLLTLGVCRAITPHRAHALQDAGGAGAVDVRPVPGARGASCGPATPATGRRRETLHVQHAYAYSLLDTPATRATPDPRGAPPTP
jgi:hypothetical protein